MKQKKTLDHMRMSRANIYFSLVVAALIALMIFLNS
jgi:hypothetical protein